MPSKNIIILPEQYLNEKMLDYLSEHDKKEILIDIKNDFTFIAGVYDINNVMTSIFICDNFVERIHLRECGGQFIKDYFYIDVFLSAYGRVTKKKFITINQTRTPKFIMKRLNFVKSEHGYERSVV